MSHLIFLSHGFHWSPSNSWNTVLRIIPASSKTKKNELMKIKTGFDSISQKTMDEMGPY